MMREGRVPNLAIVTAYNDMLSAHQPYERFPELIRQSAREAGGVAQVAGGVPAMCDGITQGEAGHGAVAVLARRHRLVDRDRAVASDLRRRGVPRHLRQDRAGPRDRRAVFRAFAGGLHSVGSDDVGPRQRRKSRKSARPTPRARSVARRCSRRKPRPITAPGTCTFYGTANTNQMLMEIMGLHLPGASFVNPNTPLRDALTRAATERALAITSLGNDYTPIGQMLDERAFVNGIVGLHATGGSTNHTLHLVAMAAAAGITLTWDDFADLAEVTPLLARIYPNGSRGREPLSCRRRHGLPDPANCSVPGSCTRDVATVCGEGLEAYRQEPMLDAAGTLSWRDGAGGERR